MLSDDLEILIEEKRREIQIEKSDLGLSQENRNVYGAGEEERQKRLPCNRRAVENQDSAEEDSGERNSEEIPADLERYIRRYLGLPVMLKTGEFSPNNPLIRGERASGDVLFGLGEYEQRKNTLKKIQQRQYREYLDQQAKLKQEAREKAEREAREREERDRVLECERERDILERDGGRRRASFSRTSVCGANNAYTTKVDTAVQVDRHTPLSVAVQTDDCDLRLNGTNVLTQAERELSPRTVLDQHKHSAWNCNYSKPWNVRSEDLTGRRRSYGDFDDRNKRSDKYTPSILDAEVIQMRNQKAVQEAADRRLRYQQELRKQIHEQQAIRVERENREKMLEQAEMRRLEEQLRSLKTAQEREKRRHVDIADSINRSAIQYEADRVAIQKEIDEENKLLLKAKTNVNYEKRQDRMFSPNYDLESYLRKNLNPTKESLLSSTLGRNYREKLPENGEMSRSFRNYEEVRMPNEMTRSWHGNAGMEDNKYKMIDWHPDENCSKPDRNERKYVTCRDSPRNITRNRLTESNINEYGDAIEREMKRDEHRQERTNYNTKEADPESVTTQNRHLGTGTFDLPIPVLRHSPVHRHDMKELNELSEEMKVVDDKWKVPAVQKNILKSLRSEGKEISLLTQLGSIRRQLQLEQMKLDHNKKD